MPDSSLQQFTEESGANSGIGSQVQTGNGINLGKALENSSLMTESLDDDEKNYAYATNCQSREDSEVHHRRQGPSASYPEAIHDSSSAGGPTENKQKDLDDSDAPIVLKPKKRLSSGAFRLVHVLSISVVIVLLSLDHTDDFWDWRPDTYLADLFYFVFQIASKVVDVLIMTSLTTVAIDLTKRFLVGSRLPFWLVMCAYRVDDLAFFFTSLFHGRLGGSPLGQKRLDRREMRTSIMLGFLVFLCNFLSLFLGPSAAVLIIPELDWFPLRKAFSNVRTPFYYALPPERTWPSIISKTQLERDGQLDKCNDFNSRYAFWCPTASFPELSSWIVNWASTGAEHDPVFHVPRTNMTRPLAIYHGLHRTAATTMSLPPLLTMARILSMRHSLGIISRQRKVRFTTTHRSTVYQPLVQTSCSMYSNLDVTRNPEAHVSFPTEELECFGDPQCEAVLTESRFMSSFEW
mgnify:CR=1 FL=1|jgi:hypothetical protein